MHDLTSSHYFMCSNLAFDSTNDDDTEVLGREEEECDLNRRIRVVRHPLLLDALRS